MGASVAALLAVLMLWSGVLGGRAAGAGAFADGVKGAAGAGPPNTYSECPPPAQSVVIAWGRNPCLSSTRPTHPGHALGSLRCAGLGAYSRVDRGCQRAAHAGVAGERGRRGHLLLGVLRI